MEYTGGCGLSRAGHYACALAGFAAALLAATLGLTALVALLGVPDLLASFAIVFGFFALWAGAWLAAEVAWHHWIARRTTRDTTEQRTTD